MDREKKFKIFLTDFPFESLEVEREVLEQQGFNFKAELAQDWCETPDEVIAAAGNSDVLLVHHAPITREVIEALSGLKVIGRYGTGYDVVDVEAASERGIYLVNAPDYCVEEVSTHVIGFLIALVRKIGYLHNFIMAEKWESEEDFRRAGRISRLKGKRLGLIGFGRIGQRVAGKARALGLEVLVYKRRSNKKLPADFEIKYVGLEELLKKSDFVSLHVPLNAETENLLAEREFSLMKPEALLINTSRGRVLREDDLVTALKNGEIAGAALDVFAGEPLEKGHPLFGFDGRKVVLTPHSAFYSEEAEIDVRRRVLTAAVELLQGRKPDNLVNQEIWQD